MGRGVRRSSERDVTPLTRWTADMSTCAGTNKDGSSCSNTPMSGSDYCHLHQDQTAGPAEDQPARPARTFLKLVTYGVIISYLLALAVSCEVDHLVFGG